MKQYNRIEIKQPSNSSSYNLAQHQPGEREVPTIRKERALASKGTLDFRVGLNFS